MAEAARAAFEAAVAAGKSREAIARIAEEAQALSERRAEADRRAELEAKFKKAGEEIKGDFLEETGAMPKGGASGKRRRRRRVTTTTAKRFCGCIKKVKSAKKTRTEGSAIAICTSSLLWPHGKTLHSVSCRRKNHLKTQKRKK
jgi:hypothetical protein